MEQCLVIELGLIQCAVDTAPGHQFLVGALLDDLTIADNENQVSVADGVEIVGWGNGDSAFRCEEQPADRAAKEYNIEAFNGCAQLIVRGQGRVNVDIVR